MAAPRRVCLFTGISGTLGHDFSARYGGAYELVGVYNDTTPRAPFVPFDSSSTRGDGRFYGVMADLSTEGAVEELVEKVLSRYDSVDLLVNAAVYRELGPIRRRAWVESLVWQFYINVCVPLELVSALARRSWSQTPDQNRERGRNIVNLSSTAGHQVYPGTGQSGYAATKAALDMFTRHMAREMADLGVRANAVAPNTFPGWVPTQSVSNAIRRYDQGDMSGEVLVIDRDGEELLFEDYRDAGAEGRGPSGRRPPAAVAATRPTVRATAHPNG
jgi:NAD(P)-dependent dehydrogenase (short-subunit alcohol dehydrogenase family)